MVISLFYNILVITLMWLYSSVLNNYPLRARPTYEPLFFAHVGKFERFVIDPYLLLFVNTRILYMDQPITRRPIPASCLCNLAPALLLLL